MSIFMEKDTDSDLLVNAKSLQTEQIIAGRWRSLQEVEYTGFRGNCKKIIHLKVIMTT